MKDISEERLVRALGVGGAVMMGLGSIVGTGVFVSIGIAAGIAGPAVILAIMVAAGVATCNAFNSAQLAAARPVSGGTYEYGYEFLNAPLGFTAGWMFLCAKSASAATAALGFAGYLLQAIDMGDGLLVPVAAGTALLLTLVVLSGIRRSNWTNIAIVSITLLALGYFIVGGTPTLRADAWDNMVPFFQSPDDPEAGALQSLLHASALMFVAFTGYGRIATLGEEVMDPKRVIPRAIVLTLVVVSLLYIGVGVVAVAAVGAAELGEAARADAAPLEVAMQALNLPGGMAIISLAAMTAMIGVLLNLILGLSRVLLAMGRRRDMPGITTRLNKARTTPTIATIVVGAVIVGLTLIGDVRTTWSFSAFTVLLYYSITNLAALQLKPEDRIYHPAFAWCGLGACLFLAFWVHMHIWLIGLGVVALGLVWYFVADRIRRRSEQ